MNKLIQVLSGIGLLICLYLVVSNRKATVDIINSIGSNSISGIKTLQGR